MKTKFKLGQRIQWKFGTKGQSYTIEEISSPYTYVISSGLPQATTFMIHESEAEPYDYQTGDAVMILTDDGRSVVGRIVSKSVSVDKTTYWVQSEKDPQNVHVVSDPENISLVEEYYFNPYEFNQATHQELDMRAGLNGEATKGCQHKKILYAPLLGAPHHICEKCGEKL